MSTRECPSKEETLSLIVAQAITEYGPPPYLTDVDVPGYTSALQRQLLTAICGYELAPTYLEIGVFQGASLLAAAHGNFLGRFYGVDNFVEGTGDLAKANIATNEKACGPITLIEKRVQDLDVSELPTVDIFFYDANFSSVASVDSLRRLWPAFADVFVLIVDNWSLPEVRANTWSTLHALESTVYAQWQLMSEVDQDIDGWGNGWCVAIVKKSPLRSTTSLKKLKPGHVPLWDVKRRRDVGLLTIDDYEVADDSKD